MICRLPRPDMTEGCLVRKRRLSPERFGSSAPGFRSRGGCAIWHCLTLAINSKLRGCDLVALRVQDVCVGGRVNERAVIIQKKTQRTVRFELTEPTRQAVQRWIVESALRNDDYVFTNRVSGSTHLSTRQYARTVNRWVACIDLDPQKYGTHSLRRTKAALIYKKTGNL
jgi:integrase